MRILSFDQATIKPAFSVFADGKLIDYGCKTFTDSDINIRINQVKDFVACMISLYYPDLVVYEGVQFQKNQKTYKELSGLLGVLVNYCVDNEILYEVIEAPKWRGGLNIKGKKREEQKANAIEYIKDNYKLSVNDDVAEAICIGEYAGKFIKIIK